jgi:2-desacetyl-2-hydroxyethyl bacteriochlorophyllide A dehydrogenase
MHTADAIVFTAVNQVQVQPLNVPDPAPDEVQIRTLYSVISGGTEGWILGNLFTWVPTQYPCVPGYQRVGVIEKIGAEVEGWAAGTTVVATRSAWTGAVNAQNGAHAALGNTPASELYALPEGVDLVDAAGTVVAQVGYNAASRVIMTPGDWVVVYGDGLIGQCAAQAARARGARVILVGHRDERLQLAAHYSTDAVINNHMLPVVETVRDITGQEFVTAILDSVQAEAAQQEYMPLLERCLGQIVYCGFTPGTVWADMGYLQRREVTTHFISGWTRERMQATLALFASGHLRLRPLITHLVPYTDGPEMYTINRTKNMAFLGMGLDWTGGRS